MKKHLPKCIVATAILGFFSVFLVLVLAYGYGLHNYNQERVQPIAYSHQIHVQKNGMKCTQCHLNVDKGAYATVPPMSVCMKCHTTVGGSTPFAKREIGKLRKYWKQKAPIPWKRIYKIPRTGMVYFTHKRHVKYFMPRNLESAFQEQGVGPKVSETMAFTYGKRVTEEYSPEEIQTALLSQKTDPKLASRVSQSWASVQDGALKKTCYTCHGKVEYMGTPRKMSPLKMGWCVSCHVKYRAPKDCSTCHK